VEKYITDALAN